MAKIPDCFMCQDPMFSQKGSQHPQKIPELDVSTAIVNRDWQFFKGSAILVFQDHVTELHHLPQELQRRFLDLETTGLNPSFDRIIELSALKVYPDGSEEEKSVRVNPEMPISAGASRMSEEIEDQRVNHVGDIGQHFTRRSGT